jgi:hypothetical protein
MCTRFQGTCFVALGIMEEIDLMDLKCLGQMVCCGATSGKLSTNVATKAWVLPFPGRRSNDIALVRLQQGTVEELGSTGLATHASRTCLFSLPCFKVNFFFPVGFCACACRERCTSKLFLFPCRAILNLPGVIGYVTLDNFFFFTSRSCCPVRLYAY